ncbi:MAG: hypothetical protein ACE5FE_00100, partial [Acidiferrobacterales bacterium]
VGPDHESRVRRETLEAWARHWIKGFLQALLEEEVTAFWGRRKSERPQAVQADPDLPSRGPGG